MLCLVLGATGFVGKSVANALVRAGYVVYGSTRSASKEIQLAADEIIPVVSDPTTDDEWTAIARTVDIVIDCIGGDAPIDTLAMSIFHRVEAIAQEVRANSSVKLAYIWTSGTWVHGENRSNILSDRSPAPFSVPLTGWRKEVEAKIISSPHVDGSVIRGGLLYGRDGSLFSFIFEGASKGDHFEAPGTAGGRFSLCHTDDLAELYVLAAEKTKIASGVVFDACNSISESQSDVYDALARHFNCPGWTFRPPNNLFESAFATTNIIRPTLAKSLLGWVPKKAGLVDGMAIYAESWKASQ